MAGERHPRPLRRRQRAGQPRAGALHPRVPVSPADPADRQARALLDPRPERTDPGRARAAGRGRADRHARLLPRRRLHHRRHRQPSGACHPAGQSRARRGAQRRLSPGAGAPVSARRRGRARRRALGRVPSRQARRRGQAAGRRRRQRGGQLRGGRRDLRARRRTAARRAAPALPGHRHAPRRRPRHPSRLFRRPARQPHRGFQGVAGPRPAAGRSARHHRRRLARLPPSGQRHLCRRPARRRR